MGRDVGYRDVQARVPTFDFEELLTSPYCEAALELRQWCDALDEWLGAQPTTIKLSQAKVLLFDQWMSVRAHLDAEHRDHTNAEDHSCVYHVAITMYESLRKRELMGVNPPAIFETQVAERRTSPWYQLGIDDVLSSA